LSAAAADLKLACFGSESQEAIVAAAATAARYSILVLVMAIIGWAGGWFGQEQRVIACLNVQRHALPTAYSLMRACWENCVLALACWGTQAYPASYYCII